MNDLKVKTITVSENVRYVDPTGTVRLPESPRKLSDWTHERYGHLINCYMLWIREGNTSDQAFSQKIATEILEGKHPILEKPLGQKQFTAAAIKSQLGLLKQPENCVIVRTDDTISVYPCNLSIITTFQKAGEARKSRDSKKLKDLAWISKVEDARLEAKRGEVLDQLTNMRSSIKELEDEELKHTFKDAYLGLVNDLKERGVLGCEYQFLSDFDFEDSFDC